LGLKLIWNRSFVTADEIEELDKENEEKDSYTSEENEIINNDYKRKAIEFWKSRKKTRYSLLSCTASI